MIRTLIDEILERKTMLRRPKLRTIVSVRYCPCCGTSGGGCIRRISRHTRVKDRYLCLGCQTRFDVIRR